MELENKILAENFYLDLTRKSYVAEMQELIKKAGPIKSIDDIEPYNQLRGSFKIQAENGVVNVFFTLSPEKNPKVQRLDLSLE